METERDVGDGRGPEAYHELAARLKTLGLMRTLEIMKREWNERIDLGNGPSSLSDSGDAERVGADADYAVPARSDARARPAFDVEPIAADELAQLIARRQPLRRASSVGLPPALAAAKGITAASTSRRNSADRFPSLTRGRSMSLTGAQFEAIHELDKSGGATKLRSVSDDRDSGNGSIISSSSALHRASIARSSLSGCDIPPVLRGLSEASSLGMGSIPSLRQLEGVAIGRIGSIRSVASDADYDQFSLRIVCDKDHTITEQQSAAEYPIVPNDIIAGRYKIVSLIASSVFGHAVHCIDVVSGSAVCVKIVRRESGYLEQGLDEIRLLRAVSLPGESYDDSDAILKFMDAFYYREQLFIVTELLRDNLFEHAKSVKKAAGAPYYTLARLRSIATQLLRALAHVHRLGVVHGDVKPENIVFKSRSECVVKLIDFGSGFYVGDSHRTYVQSRPYRAPEVILGTSLGTKMDVWSVGCVLAELYTGCVLFPSYSVAVMLARIESVLGPLSAQLIGEGVNAHKYYVRRSASTGDAESSDVDVALPKTEGGVVGKSAPQGFAIYERKGTSSCVILRPIPVPLVEVLATGAPTETPESLDGFARFIAFLLRPDPTERPTALEALDHAWLAES
eukprot:Opistho-2@75605